MAPAGNAPKERSLADMAHPAKPGLGERIFFIAFATSLGLHLIVFAGPLMSLPWFRLPQRRLPLEVIYQYEIAHKDVQRLKERLARASHTAQAPSPTESAGRLQIRIPERPVLATTQALPTIISQRSSVIDLTNLSEASQGDPVLLSYFSALREQIQRRANARGWFTGDVRQGLVYISFVLNAGGSIQKAWVVADRSVTSNSLREIAIRIVKSAAPFPPFPPSFGEAKKTIIVPLEFMSGT